MLYDVARRFGGAADKRVCWPQPSASGKHGRVLSHLLENKTALSRANKCLEKKYYYTKE